MPRMTADDYRKAAVAAYANDDCQIDANSAVALCVGARSPGSTDSVEGDLGGGLGSRVVVRISRVGK
jgi:hypothetical protein